MAGRGVVLAVVAAAGVVAGVVLSHKPKHTLAALPPNSIGILDADGALHDAVQVGQTPDALVYGFGSLWVANSGERTVQRVNPKTHEVIETIEVGSNPTAIAMSARNVWVANGSDRSVTEIDPATTAWSSPGFRSGRCRPPSLPVRKVSGSRTAATTTCR